MIFPQPDNKEGQFFYKSPLNPSHPLVCAYSFSMNLAPCVWVKQESFYFTIYFEDFCTKLWCLPWVLSPSYRCLECIGKPGLQGLAYSSVCRLCTGWRSHNPQTDLNSSRKALDPESTHFLQTTWPKRDGIFGHGWNPWLKSATSGHRHMRTCTHACNRLHTSVHVHTQTAPTCTLIHAHTPPQPSPAVGESSDWPVERGSLSSY